MVWKSNGTLKCDSCTLVFDFPGPRVEVIRAARAHGWHIYIGPNVFDTKNIESYVCKDCIGRAASRLPAPARFAEEIPLFEEEGS